MKLHPENLFLKGYLNEALNSTLYICIKTGIFLRSAFLSSCNKYSLTINLEIIHLYVNLYVFDLDLKFLGFLGGFRVFSIGYFFCCCCLIS